MSCIFCKIVSGSVPGYKIYENNRVLAFLDVAPASHGHVLVIPKKHYVDIEDITEEELIEVIKVVKIVGYALKEKMGVSGYNVSGNNGSVAGQIVPHVHFHVIPRKEGDNFFLWPQGRYEDGEAEMIAEKLRFD